MGTATYQSVDPIAHPIISVGGVVVELLWVRRGETSGRKWAWRRVSSSTCERHPQMPLARRAASDICGPRTRWTTPVMSCARRVVPDGESARR